MSMLCNNNRVCWVVFHFIKLLHSKHLSSFLQNFSTRSFRCGKQYTVQKTITRSLHTNCTLESILSRIFLLSLDFFFFFLLSCSALANCNIPSFFFLLSMREQKFVSTLNPVKNVAIQISGRGPNCTAQTLSLWTIAFSECEREYPYLHIYQKGIVTFDFVLGHKSLEISLKFSQPRFLTAKQKSKLMTVDIWKSYMWTAD